MGQGKDKLVSRARLEYDLPEEDYELSLALNAGKVHAAASEFANYLRQLYKYESDQYSPEQNKLIEQIRNRFWEEFGDLLD